MTQVTLQILNAVLCGLANGEADRYVIFYGRSHKALFPLPFMLPHAQITSFLFLQAGREARNACNHRRQTIFMELAFSLSLSLCVSLSLALFFGCGFRVPRCQASLLPEFESFKAPGLNVGSRVQRRVPGSRSCVDWRERAASRVDKSSLLNIVLLFIEAVFTRGWFNLPAQGISFQF